jgi:hypothetical protein
MIMERERAPRRPKFLHLVNNTNMHADARGQPRSTATASCASAARTGDLRQIDLAGLRPRPSLCAEFCIESSFSYEFVIRFEFSLELRFGNGEIDHKTESVGDLPSR